MDVDMNTNDYNINQIEETAAIYEQQQVDYKADYLKKYLKLVDQIKENADGTKTLKIQNINEVTEEVFVKHSVDDIDLERDIITKYGGKIIHGRLFQVQDVGYFCERMKITAYHGAAWFQ